MRFLRIDLILPPTLGIPRYVIMSIYHACFYHIIAHGIRAFASLPEYKLHVGDIKPAEHRGYLRNTAYR